MFKNLKINKSSETRASYLGMLKWGNAEKMSALIRLLY
jgi:hypothetical protein